MLYIILIFILWTWGLTPLWVNIVCTILCAIAILGCTEDGFFNRLD